MRESSPILHLSAVGVVVVPVADQEASVAFFTDVLGLENISDFTYETGERWVEVVPPGSLTRLTLVAATAERPAGVETGVIFSSSDAAADHAALHAAGADVDDALLVPDEVVLWAGAPLAGNPAMFRLRDPDGNSFLVVQAT